MNWEEILDFLEEQIGKRPKDLKAVLFLVGVQELGKGPKSFSKEEKQDLIHIGTCRLLAQRGYYVFQGLDEEGWPHYDVASGIPEMNIEFQEKLLIELCGQYFKENFHENHNL